MEISRIVGGALLLGLGLLPAAALATLGQALPPGAVAGNSPQPLALRAVPQAAYSVAHSQDPAGRRIREFAGADGIVFAVAWQGASLPDMRQLLGDYFPAYVSSQQSNRAGLNRLDGHRPGLVVISAGRARAFHGLAYVPALLPAGLDIEQLK
ncbi:DUF2844 domain-containing protein [Chromobacterium aquaticum]|uniref:DUF2844 domain-containing protein n=1 Tax=Chromobacterium aquaticum TaxID=467180 RepID=A0ABV8ZZ20_9NEIS|nr:DUF2844 domain-containing protein [Chromobacterium aquaticum]MCD5360563.1 DUF2844 domain-containing protein [Chromobacterium aquaticum]